MELGEQRDGEILVLVPQGRIDSANAAAFERSVLGHLEAGSRAVLLDFGSLAYISSAGLRVVLVAAKRVKAVGGRFGLCALSDNIREVFEVSGFSSILDIWSDRAAGIAGMRGAS